MSALVERQLEQKCTRPRCTLPAAGPFLFDRCILGRWVSRERRDWFVDTRERSILASRIPIPSPPLVARPRLDAGPMSL